MADIDNFNQTWQGLTHGQVEDAIKAKVAALEAAIAEGNTDIDTLQSSVQSLQTAINNLPTTYQASSVVGINGYDHLLAKLQAMDEAITAAAQSGGEVDLTDYYTKTDADGRFVVKETGKGLSTNDYTDGEKRKLQGIAAGAEVNVQPDWEQTDSAADDYIKNKPNIDLSNYYNKQEVDAKIGEIEAGESVVISMDEVDIIDSHSSSTKLAAPSARQMKLAADNIETLFSKVNDLYDKLAGVAFTNGKPANWKVNAVWTGSVANYTIGLAAADEHITLTDGNGNAITSPQEEGSTVNIVIGVGTGYRFTAAPTATMGGNVLTVTQSGNNYVIAISALAGNVVINATTTLLGSYGVTIPTGAEFCTSNGASASAPTITEGNNWTGYIKPSSGKRWATAPTSSGATVTLHSGDIYKIVASNVQADITVNGAVEAIPTYTISLPNDAHITVDNGSGGNVPASVLEGTALTIRLTPANSYRITVNTMTMGGTQLPAPTDANGVLTFTIASVTGNVMIAATAAEVVEYAVRNHLINMTSNGAGRVEYGDGYTADIVVDNGATSWDDLRVMVGGINVTSDCTKTDITGGKRLVIPASVITGNIDIVAAAYNDIVEVKTTANAGTTIQIKGNGTDWNASNITTLAVGDSHVDDNGTFTLAANDTIRFMAHDINEINIGTKTAIKSIDFGGAKVSFKSEMFRDFSGVESVVNYVPRAYRGNNNINGLFFGCSQLASVDLSHFSMSEAKNINMSFRNCPSLQSLYLQGADLSNVNDITSLFNGATALTEFDASDVDLSGITNISGLFYECTALRKVDLSGNGNTIAPENINYWFQGAASNIVLTIGELDLSGVTSSDFHQCNKVSVLFCKSQTPPNSALFTYFTGLTAIYVPSAAVNAYKSAWAGKADIIHSINDYNG